MSSARSARLGGAPLRLLLTPAPWAATAYLVSYLVVGPALFAFLVAVLLLALVANITWLGLPVAVGAAGLVRGCANVERLRARGITGVVVVGGYAAVTGSGVIAQARLRWSDPATHRDLVLLVLLFPVLLVLDTAALVLWVSVLGLITLPAWFWAIPQTWPNGETGHGLMIGSFPDGPAAGGVGLWIGDVGTALLVAAGAVVVAVLIGAPAVTAIARLHVWAVARLLGPGVDPLAPVRAVLDAPGPLPIDPYGARTRGATTHDMDAHRTEEIRGVNDPA
ncbi:sensor domain-containing protein [Actinokineospora bangkokensis]|uniref:Putative sensor domain-containing protein n=1 Tax=Actinokineospora bangkokensis TaxID=1193682 RepID=A0A1Q9LIR1_9PSEU|nr:sensor domain-containing protein [Actinokineospora bangkokensis]OLR91942.1 hypothetical protein BJP25_24270 [Actinokineospora bangkokensis]